MCLWRLNTHYFAGALKASLYALKNAFLHFGIRVHFAKNTAENSNTRSVIL